MAGAPEVNMADVARRAGVSIGTVSRALRDVPGVGEGTRERIKRIAAELSYVISPEASRLSGGPTGRVGIVVPRIDVWFYGEMLGSIEQTLREADLDVLVYQVKDEAQRARFFAELPSRRKVDAVILIALPLQQHELDRLDHLGVQVVVAGGRVRDFPHVEIDDRAIAADAVRHLVALGHERIAMIRASDYDDQHWDADVHRSQGYVDGLAEAGLEVPPEYVVSVPFGVGTGVQAVDRLLALDPPPTAILAYSDELALGALEGVRRAGLRVPEDLSVVGIDDHPLAAVFGLTTVRQDVARQGRTAAEMVLRMLRGDSATEPDVVVPHELVVRSSTGPAS